MSGIMMDTKKVLTVKDVTELYDMDMKQQDYHRTRNGMPYQKVGTNILYSKRKLDIYLLSEKFEFNGEA